MSADRSTSKGALSIRCVHSDAAGVVTRATRALATWLGVEPDDLAGTPLDRWWPGGGELDAQVIESGAPRRDIRWVDRGGERVAVIEERFPQLDQRGEVCGVLLVIRELDGEERELRDTAARLASVIAAAPDAIVLFDRHGRCLEIISDGHNALVYPAEAMLGRTVREIMPDAAAAIEAALRQALETRAVQELEYEVAGPTGERSFAARAMAVGSSPDSPVIWVTRDITHRRRAEQTRRLFEQQLAESQKLESLSLLAGGIARDFNNLLVSILANANHARTQISSRGAEQPLRDIESAASRAADLCQQLLAYTGATRLVTGPVELNGLIREVAASLRDSLGSIELSLELGPDVIMVDCDRSHIRHVVRALVINAAEAISGPGRIVVSSESRVVSSDELSRSRADTLISEGRYSVIEVADSGCGMPAELADRAFEPFVSTKFGSRGLGLAAAVGIMRSHQGAIILDSEPGSGSSVRLYLPDRRLARGSVSGSPRGRLILLVDDDELIREVAQRILESVDYAVITAADGREGVERYRAVAGTIDCVIMDLKLPVLGGGEAARQIRAMDRSVPLILASGYTEDEYTGLIKGDPQMWFLQKPYRANQLVYAVRRALATGRD